ncbi:hypothetical protein GCM10025771_28360 [Niveibacterium umoris]|uniref:Transglutaminase-like putative cysteine protease n=1 Tax=Niveibacterium umoris TaxID=1193620 RepID=A0A840BEL6_9RHOO|nr:DUF3488 and transglutaminase-like domain-containing protein [Niveibacterium umoris]MBB4011971.1 transglutaminase-like putative cysteine protease [Niveibacterium umoris]
MNPPRPLDRRTGIWVLATVALTQIPLLFRLAPEVGLVAAIPMLWQAWRLRSAALGRPPHFIILILLAAMSVATTTAHYGTIFGRTPGLALIAMLLGLKVLESRNRRDAHVSVQLCFFLQLGYFLIEQSALTAASASVACAIAVTTLLRIEQPELGTKASAAASLKLIGIAIPLAVVLFVLFPRLDSPLWGLPTDGRESTTGMSDHMRAGSIANLSLSGEIAFRVEFSGAVPEPAARYFRGPVMSAFDGQEWRVGPSGPPSEPPQGGKPTDYVITMEPNENRWLFALEHALPAAGQTLSSANVLLAAAPIRSRLRVSLSSRIGSRIGQDTSDALAAFNLTLPKGTNPRMAALGADLRNRLPDPAARVEEGLRLLRVGQFVYTLEPPTLGADSADEFFFDSKRGFCEHFANAFAVLMRAAGVPTRVVGGYQGGEINPVDGTLIVRQSDAHAWTEVWLANRGWVRVDPTAAAAPRRIDGGVTASLPASEPIPRLVRVDAAWLRALRDRAEALSHAWNTWFLGYNAQRQRDFITQLGFDPDWRTLTLLLAASAAAWQAVVWAAMFRRRSALTPAEREWTRLLRTLARKGLSPAPSEGPIAFAARAGTIHPEWRDALDAFAKSYARITYGPPHASPAVEALRNEISAWIAQNS